MANVGGFSDEDDDDSDLFMKRDGTSGAVSYFALAAAQNTTSNGSDDDDEEEDLGALPPVSRRRKRRGRAIKERRVDVVDVDAEPIAETTTASAPASVFSSTPVGMTGDTEVIDLDGDEGVINQTDEVSTAAARTQARAEELLSHRRRQRGLTLEESIEEEARQEAAKKEQERKRAEEAERAKAEAAAREAKRRADEAAARLAAATRTTSDDTGGANGEAVGPSITLKVRYAETSKTLRMKIHKGDPLVKMLPMFCEKLNIEFAKAVMEVDGEEVENEDTAETYDLEDMNLVDVRLRK